MMRNSDNGKYILQNKLRTWSELKLENALAAGSSPTSTRRENYIPERRWDQPSNAVRSKGQPRGSSTAHPRESGGRVGRIDADRRHHSFEGGKSTSGLPAAAQGKDAGVEDTEPDQRPSGPSSGLADEGLGPTDTPTLYPPHPFPTNYGERPARPRLFSPERGYLFQSGRDFGGSMSGAASRASSRDDNNSSDDELRATMRASARVEDDRMTGCYDRQVDDNENDDGDENEEDAEEVQDVGCGPQADALGDHQQPLSCPRPRLELGTPNQSVAEDKGEEQNQFESKRHNGKDATTGTGISGAEEETEGAEAWDKSIQGSVYENR